MPRARPQAEFERQYVVRDAERIRRHVGKRPSLVSFLSEAYQQIQEQFGGSRVLLEVDSGQEVLVVSVVPELTSDAPIGDFARWWSARAPKEVSLKLVRRRPGGPAIFRLVGSQLKEDSVGLKEFIGREIGVVPEVERVLVSLEGDSVVAWSIVSNASDEVRYRIYDRESAIMDLLPDVNFDFHVIDRGQRRVDELISDVAVAFQRQ